MEGGRLENQAFVLEVMERLDFFERFTPFERRFLVQFHQHVVVYEAGEVIVSEGEKDLCFYIILSGNVDVSKGGDFIVGLGPGEIFGESSFLARKPRAATVTATEETIAIKVDDTLFEDLSPEIREKIKDNLMEKLIERLQYMNDLVQEFKSEGGKTDKELIIRKEPTVEHKLDWDAWMGG